METTRTEAERREARFWQRFFVGAELADRLRFMTLNSSDESVVLGLDILDSFSKLVKRARRKYGILEYFGVVEQDRDRGYVGCSPQEYKALYQRGL